jgi:hypothetical protein
VADVEAVLTRLGHAAESVDGSAHGLRRAARSGSWQGPAASAFRSGSADLAGGLDDAVTALRTASRTVSAWQSRLAANQREAEELEAQARALRADPEQAPALARVLDRARRLQARHLRQAAAAAAALRSATASMPGWPAAGTGRHAGQVSGWTGEVAAGLSAPVWPPADGVLPGDLLPGDVLPGEEGGSVTPVAGLPDLPGLPGLDPGLVPGPADRPDLGDGPDLGGLLPGGLAPDRWPDLDTADLPGLPVHAPGTTSAAGWLDTGHAPAVRPLDHLPAHRPLDAGLGGHLAASRHEPAAHGTPARHLAEAPVRDAVRAVRAGQPEPHRQSTGGRPVEHAAEHPDSGDREGAARTSGRGGGEHGPLRLGGHAVSAPAGGPSGPGGVVDPPAHHGPAGGSPTPTTGTPPPLPAPPIDQTFDQTVEQQAAPTPAPGPADQPRPDPARAIDTGRPDPVRAPEPGRLPEPVRAALPAPTATPAPAPLGADPGRGLEPGRMTAADPTARPGSPVPGQGPQPAKGRDGDDVSAFLLGPLPVDTTGQPVPAGGLRAFLLTRPQARPVLVLIKPGGGEPLFLTGLIPCASPLPGCAAPLAMPGATTVY